MPTIITHAVVPLAIGLGLGKTVIPRGLLIAGVIAAIAPDFDVVAFKLGIAYADAFGHRGASHSLMFALLLAIAAMATAPLLRASRLTTLWFIFVAAASHPLLDMLTNGGLGVALYWPFSTQRVFFAWREIEVSPIGLSRFLSARGLTVICSELLWVWLPAGLMGALLFIVRKRRTTSDFQPG